MSEITELPVVYELNKVYEVPGICSYKNKNLCGRICGNKGCKKHAALIKHNQIQQVAMHLFEHQPLHTFITGANIADLLFTKWKSFPDDSHTIDKEMLVYLCDIGTLREIVCDLRIHISLRSKKEVLVVSILTKLYYLYCYLQVPAVMNVIMRAQRRIRANRWIRLQGPWRDPSVHITNTEDPITLTPVDELPPMEIWSFRDDQGHVYAFHAPVIHYAIFRLGAWNPMNRKPIPEVDINRLEQMMDVLPWRRNV